MLSSDHVHMFVPVPPKLAVSDLMRLMKGRSSHKMQREFPDLKALCEVLHHLTRPEIEDFNALRDARCVWCFVKGYHEDKAAQHMPIIDAWLAVGLWKAGPKSRYLRIRQPEKVAEITGGVGYRLTTSPPDADKSFVNLAIAMALLR